MSLTFMVVGSVVVFGFVGACVYVSRRRKKARSLHRRDVKSSIEPTIDLGVSMPTGRSSTPTSGFGGKSAVTGGHIGGESLETGGSFGDAVGEVVSEVVKSVGDAL